MGLRVCVSFLGEEVVQQWTSSMMLKQALWCQGCLPAGHCNPGAGRALFMLDSQDLSVRSWDLIWDDQCGKEKNYCVTRIQRKALLWLFYGFLQFQVSALTCHVVWMAVPMWQESDTSQEFSEYYRETEREGGREGGSAAEYRKVELQTFNMLLSLEMHIQTESGVSNYFWAEASDSDLWPLGFHSIPHCLWSWRLLS